LGNSAAGVQGLVPAGGAEAATSSPCLNRSFSADSFGQYTSGEIPPAVRDGSPDPANRARTKINWDVRPQGCSSQVWLQQELF